LTNHHQLGSISLSHLQRQSLRAPKRAGLPDGLKAYLIKSTIKSARP